MANEKGENQVYHDDNSFNNNGIEVPEEGNVPNTGNDTYMGPNSGFSRGFKGADNTLGAGKNNAALGQKKSNSDLGKPGNSDKANQPDKPNSSLPPKDDNFPDKKSENVPRNNPLPGGNKPATPNDPASKPKPKSNTLGSNQSKSDEGFNPKKAFSALSPGNIANGIRSRLGLGKKPDADEKDDSGKAGESDTGKSVGNIVNTIVALPLSAKIAIGSFAIFIVLGLLFLVLLGSITGAMTSLMCNDSSNNSYSFNGTADEKEFMCKMQNPLASPSVYTVTSLCGYNVDSTHAGRWHNGIDLGTYGQANSPIYAVQGGKVIETYDACSVGDHSCGGGMGNHVIIDHGGITTTYMHMKLGSVKVSKDQIVGKGQHIGNVGNTGNSYGEHLHFEMRVKSNNQVITSVNDYFTDNKGFIANCGSSWEGDNAGDSANVPVTISDDATYTSTSTSSNDRCCVGSSAPSSSSGTDYCPNGITVTGSGTFDLDDYIAGVISAENSYEKNGNIEASKANAVAARTYALNSTDNCKKAIGNSSSSQNYTSPSSIGKRAASETSGQVMLYNGEVFSAEYDAFCINDADCPDSTCSGDSCTVSYLRKPSQEKHKITLRKGSSLYDTVISGGYNDIGHARGMSQLVARQMQDEGKTYDEILRFFYADGIEITGAPTNTCSVGASGFLSKIWAFFQTDYSEPYGTYGTIATHGCGPTSMAIVTSSLLGVAHDPIELTNYACSNNYCSDAGTAWSFFPAAAKKYGLKVKEISISNSDEVLTQLNKGNTLVISIMGPGTFTSGGHFIVLTSTDGTNVAVQDPASAERSKKTYDFKKVITKEAKNFWVFSK